MQQTIQKKDAGQAVLFYGAGQPLRAGSFDVRELQPGEVLVKNRYTTLCGSDLHTYCGLRNEPCPTVLGHEIVGEIIALHPTHSGTDGLGATLQPGDLITWSIFAADPDSAAARQGMPQKGDGLFKYGHAVAADPDVFHGGLAEYCILKAHTAILKIPAGIPVPVAATLNCAISTVAGAIRLAGPLHGKTVLITGMGLLGITCAAMCREAGASHVIAADVVEGRLADAGLFGADRTLLLPYHTPGDLAVDVAFDMSGAPAAMELGLEAMGLGGVAVWVGAVFSTRAVQVNAERVIRRLQTIRGLHNYNYDDFKYALRFMEAHHQTYPFHRVVEKEFPLHQAAEAFDYAIQHKPYRVGILI